MKMIIAIVQDQDSQELSDQLVKKQFQSYKVSNYWWIFKSRQYNFLMWG